MLMWSKMTPLCFPHWRPKSTVAFTCYFLQLFLFLFLIFLQFLFFVSFTIFTEPFFYYGPLAFNMFLFAAFTMDHDLICLEIFFFL